MIDITSVQLARILNDISLDISEGITEDPSYLSSIIIDVMRVDYSDIVERRYGREIREIVIFLLEEDKATFSNITKSELVNIVTMLMFFTVPDDINPMVIDAQTDEIQLQILNRLTEYFYGLGVVERAPINPVYEDILIGDNKEEKEIISPSNSNFSADILMNGINEEVQINSTKARVTNINDARVHDFPIPTSINEDVIEVSNQAVENVGIKEINRTVNDIIDIDRTSMETEELGIKTIPMKTSIPMVEQQGTSINKEKNLIELLGINSANQTEEIPSQMNGTTGAVGLSFR